MQFRSISAPRINSIVIGVSDGSANQQFALPQSQVDPATFVLEVDMPGFGFVAWQQVDDLSVLQGPAMAYVLDPEAGTVTFGNQLQGMIVPAGRRVRVRTMRAGGGSAGNLPAGSLTAIQAFDLSGVQVPQTITVQQPVATSGGADPETLDSAQQRIPSLLQNQSRAVTAADYSNLAQHVPGANVARVEVLPLFMPQTRTPNVPGVVSVMVIPNKTGVLESLPARRPAYARDRVPISRSLPPGRGGDVRHRQRIRRPRNRRRHRSEDRLRPAAGFAGRGNRVAQLSLASRPRRPRQHRLAAGP